MGIYGGKTYGDNSFVFDAVYDNYVQMLEGINNIFVNRYVLVMYSDVAYSIEERQLIESATTEEGLDEDQKKYKKNYTIDMRNTGRGHDRTVYQATWDTSEQKIVPREVTNLNNGLTNNYAQFLLHWQNSLGEQTSTEVGYLQCTSAELEALSKTPGRIYAITDTGALYIDIDANRRVQLSASIDAISDLLANIHCVKAPSPVYYLSSEPKDEIWVYDGQETPEDYNFKGGLVNSIEDFIYGIQNSLCLEVPVRVKEIEFKKPLSFDVEYLLPTINIKGNGVTFINFQLENNIRYESKNNLDNILFKNDLVHPLQFKSLHQGDCYISNCAFFFENSDVPLFHVYSTPCIHKFENCLFSGGRAVTAFRSERGGAKKFNSCSYNNCVFLEGAKYTDIFIELEDEETQTTETENCYYFEHSENLTPVSAPELSWGCDWFSETKFSLIDFIRAAKKPKVVVSKIEPIDKDAIWVEEGEVEADYIVESYQKTTNIDPNSTDEKKLSQVSWLVQKYRSGLTKCYGKSQPIILSTIEETTNNWLVDQIQLPVAFSTVYKTDVNISEVANTTDTKSVWDFKVCCGQQFANTDYTPQGYIHQDGALIHTQYSVTIGYEVTGIVEE